MSTKTIITPSFAIYNIELEQAFKDGWRLDHDNLPNTWGTVYEALLIKDEHREDVLSAFLPEASMYSNAEMQREAEAMMKTIIATPLKKQMGRPKLKA